MSGRARMIVTVWVLIVVPVLLSLMVGAILVLPKVATSAWDSGSAIATGMPNQVSQGQVIDFLASFVQLLALVLPLLGSLLVTQKVVRMGVTHGRNWSRGSFLRGTIATAAAFLLMGGIAWAWWPSGQYQPVRANQGGTIGSLASAVVSPGSVARPVAQPVALLTPGTHLAISMIPVGGVTAQHPALHVILGGHGGQPVAIVGGGLHQLAGATAFKFHFQQDWGPNSTATAVSTKKGGVTYNVAYSLITVSNGAPVTSRNTAIAIGEHCRGCMSVAVSFQVVLIVGRSSVIAPVNFAKALNLKCPSCTTLALAEQMVVTLKKQPPKALLSELRAALMRLHDISLLRGRAAVPWILAQVTAIERTIAAELRSSGLLANTPTSTNTSSGTSGSSGGGTSTTPSSGGGSGTNPTGASTTPTSGSSSSSGGSTTGTGTATTPTTSTGTGTTTTPTSTTSTAPTSTTSSAAG